MTYEFRDASAIYLLMETVADEITDDDAEVEEVTVVDDFAELQA